MVMHRRTCASTLVQWSCIEVKSKLIMRTASACLQQPGDTDIKM